MLRQIKGHQIPWDLLRQILSGELPDDHPEFIAWLEKDRQNALLYDELKNGRETGGIHFDTSAMYQKVEQVLFPSSRRVRLLRMAGYAAAVACLMLLTVTIFYYSHIPRDFIVEVENSFYTDSIIPGTKKAQLILADGSTLALEKKFELKKENGADIQNEASGLLKYEQMTSGQTGEKAEMHRIEVPMGGEYELMLSDGTLVYLNSGSSLSYPSFFEGNVRQVELTGEAYFDVTKSDHLFIVKSADVEVRVHGTSFNLCAYYNESEIDATLVSGSIQMKTKSGEEGYFLKPGQNLNFNRSSEKVKIETVDTDIYTAWVRGEYIFRNQPIDEILNKLSKWYDFSVEFQRPEMKSLRFTGSMEKKRPIDYLLNQIEQVTNLKFKKNGNMIQVYN